MQSVFVSESHGIVSDENVHELQQRLRFLGSGVYRQTYDLGTHVLKIEKCSGDAGDANRTEIETWERVEGTDMERFFCPIVASAPDYSWLIMERCDIFADDASSEEDSIVESVRTRCERFGIADLHPGNIGRLEESGRWVVTDYGMLDGGVGRWSSSTHRCECDECVRIAHRQDCSGCYDCHSEIRSEQGSKHDAHVCDFCTCDCFDCCAANVADYWCDGAPNNVCRGRAEQYVALPNGDAAALCKSHAVDIAPWQGAQQGQQMLFTVYTAVDGRALYTWEIARGYDIAGMVCEVK